MKLLLKRIHKTDKSTIGELYIDGKQRWYVLEDVERSAGEKVYGKTAIPKGTYEVIMSMSKRFNKILPLLLNVPMFEGIRIHAGNTAEDSEGCLLVGKTRGVDFVGESRKACAELFPLMQKAFDKKEKIIITIE